MVRQAMRLASRFLLLLIPALAGALMIVFDVTPLPRLREVAFDSFQRFDPAPAPSDPPALIVAIDDASLAAIGQWPWPRDRLADLTVRLARAGVAAIVFDVLFAEPDERSPTRLVEAVPAGPRRDAVSALVGDNDTDARFASALAAAPVVLGFVAAPGGDGVAGKSGFAQAGDDVRDFLPGFSGARAPMTALSAAATGLGALNWVPDGDGVIRRVPTLVRVGDGALPSLFVEALRVAQGASTLVARGSNAGGETSFGTATGMNALKVGDITIETEASGEVRLHARRSVPALYLSAATVLGANFDATVVAGRIVFVGATAPALGDARTTPVEAAMPGVELHVQAVEAALSGAHLTRPDWMRGFEASATVTLGALIAAGFLLFRKRPGVALALGLVLMGLGLTASLWAFGSRRLLVDPVAPGLALAATLIVGLAVLSRDLERRRARVRETFGRFVTPSVVERLAEANEPPRLGGENRVLTVLFSDVRGFTALAESRDPTEVVSLLRRIHTPASAAVMDNGGTLDKYLGDGMMAFWNAPIDDPDHANHAVAAAVAMVASVEGRFDDDISIGIGLNTGIACVGNLGSETRLEYSALGDAVNLAARIEGLTKLYGVAIVASEATARAATHHVFVELDEATVVGRRDPVKLFTPLATPDPAFAAVHPSLLAALRGRVLDRAEELLAGDAYRRRARLAAVFADRIAEMRADASRSAVNVVDRK